MQILNMIKLKGRGKIKAVFSLDLNPTLPLVIRDMKLIESDSGYWVAVPNYKINGVFMGPVGVTNTQWLTLVSRLAQDEYASLA